MGNTIIFLQDTEVYDWMYIENRQMESACLTEYDKSERLWEAKLEGAKFGFVITKVK